MIDQRNANPLVVTGTPALAAGALTVDTDQGLTFNGTTNSAAAADTASLSLTGSMSLECFVKFASFPGSTQNVIVKASSYSLQVTSAGKLIWNVANSPSSASVTSIATLTTGVWYHVVCVLNQNYAGTARIGTASFGAGNIAMNGDTTKFGTASGTANLQVSTYTAQEIGLVTSMSMPIARDDETWFCDIRMAAYNDNGGVPGTLIAESDAATYNSFPVRSPTYQWITHPAAGLVTPGTVWVGYQMGRTEGQTWTTYTASGSTRKINDTFSDGPADTFGAGTLVASQTLTNYIDYTPISRTGLEGKAILYINGALDNSTAYTAGIADSANSLQVAPSVAVSVDEISVWNRALTTVEVATHYLAH